MKIDKHGKKAGGFLSRLRGDESGNIIAITAASVLPMIAVIGGGVDMSRIYMTKARLQSACDAGTLAGRKAMTTATYDSAARTRAESMFNFNYIPANYQATGTTFTTSANAQGALSGTATTTLPTVLMKIFGKKFTNITVNCGADLQVPNIDVVMVLDVTGSMNECPDGNCDTPGELRKIEALRNAVSAFYTTIRTSIPAGSTSQIRYGFVPFSQAVNGKGLFKLSPNSSLGELPLSNITDSMSVPSRVANFNTVVNNQWVIDNSVTPTSIEQVYLHSTAANREPFIASSTTPGTKMSFNDCNNYSSNRSFNIGLGSPSAPGDVKIYPNQSTFVGEGVGTSEFYQAQGTSTWVATEPTSGTSYKKMTFSKVYGPTVDSGGSNFADFAECKRQVITTTYKKGDGYKFTNWTYKNVPYNVSQFKQGNAINFVSAIDSNRTLLTNGSYDLVQLRQMTDQTGFSSSSTTWGGCLEERTTVADSNFSPIPTGAKDLNFLDPGTDTDTWWRPVAQDLAWLRSNSASETKTSNNNRPDYACPVATMRNLKTMSQAEMDAFVLTLQPNGYTYLDVGMIWGLRLISPQGMFANRNIIGPNGGQISRHVIFLTDGEPVSQGDTYSAYGLEQIDKRITGTTGVSAATLHSRRFKALCDAQRGAVNIWAIGFGTTVTGNLTNCADPTRALQANNTAQLTSSFTRIANEIADLRLVI